MLEVVRGGTGAPSGMRTFPAAVQRLLRCETPQRTREIQRGRGILSDLDHLQEQPSKVGPVTALRCVRRAVWGDAVC